MFKKLTSASLILAFAMPAATLAQTAADMDADGDGAVSMTEFTEANPDAEAGAFAEIDADADGSLTEEEISAAVDAGLLAGSE